ncbi:MAG: DUF58 domain-containing protein [Bacteroidia bacterium]|jgi:uncharacterized protein (DUF58 family)|nr:DUF58 domain-containing protein [Bacteroidia bacterium]
MTISLSETDLIQTGNLELLAKQVVEGFITGLHKSPFHGFSVEFAEHRLYNTGESTRHIDWKLFGRTDKLFVKRYEEETNLRCQIVIDDSASMYYPANRLNKIRFSAIAAASIMNLLKKQRDASGLSIIDDTISFHSPCKSSSVHQKYLLMELESLLNKLTPSKQSNIAENLHQIAEMIHKRSLVIVFSDMLQNVGDAENLFAALQHLKYNKHEVVVFQVEDNETENQFSFANKPYQFIDSESGERIKLFPNQIREAYLEASAQYKQALKLRCAQYKIDLVHAAIGTDFSQVLLPFLVKRNKLL